MNEEVKENDVVEKNTEKQTEPKEKHQPEKKYSDEDVNNIIDKKFAKWQKDLQAKDKEKEEAVEEAKRLAKMNEEEKREHERQKLEEELAEYKRKDQYYSLSREATNMLHEHGITADDELLGMIVKDTAEDTQTAVNSFVTLLNTKVEEGVKQALSGNSPRVNAGNNAVTKKQIMEIKNPVERQKAIRENINLFN